MILFSDFLLKRNEPYHINHDPQPYYNLLNKDTPDAIKLDKFFKLMAICHSVVPGYFHFKSKKNRNY